MPIVPPRFFYFDLGNVLLNFDQRRAASQVAAAAGILPDKAWQIVYETDLLIRHERGEISSREFFETFCEQAGTRPDYAILRHAASDIFEINTLIIPIVVQLKAAGYRLGILSNTNESHWGFVSNGRYTLVQSYFEVYVLSHEVGAIKPEPPIYHAAVKLAGVSPGEIFFVDDRPENVAAAKEIGIDAVPFTSAQRLGKELRDRGVRFNY